jgi:hypothetical protein
MQLRISYNISFRPQEAARLDFCWSFYQDILRVHARRSPLRHTVDTARSRPQDATRSKARVHRSIFQASLLRKMHVEARQCLDFYNRPNYALLSCCIKNCFMYRFEKEYPSVRALEASLERTFPPSAC